MKGLIFAVPRKYESTCLINIKKLREQGCDLPIEIWEIGEEISSSQRALFEKVENVVFKNVENYIDNPNHWKGFQVKAFILKHTDFEEVMLCDADVIIYQNPNLLFENEHYLNTGTCFFKDLDKWKFSKLHNPIIQFKNRFFYNKFTSASFFRKRKKWLLKLLPEKSAFFPKEWDYIYNDDLPKEPVKEALQESGIVLMNKTKHRVTIEHIYSLNNNYKETYEFVWGDKETFWIGCLMANNPFYFNSTTGYIDKKTGLLSHDFNGLKFFSQKG